MSDFQSNLVVPVDQPAGGDPDHVTPARLSSDQADQEGWNVVPYKQAARGGRRRRGRRGRRGPREPRVRNQVRRTEHTVGMIVLHADLHYFPEGQTAPHDQGHVVDLLKGGQVLEKTRLFLVVGRLIGGSVMECPILTYGGDGLSTHDDAT